MDARLERASEHVWRFTPDERTDRPSLAAVAGSRRTALLDGGASPAHLRGFLEALAPLGLPPLACVVLTHWHWDHAFGADEAGVPVVASRATAEALAVQAGYGWSDADLDARVAAGLEIAFCRDMLRLELPDRADLAVPRPTVLLDEALALDLGGLAVEVRHVGGDHAADSCVMHVPADGLLFLGDALYQRLYAPEPLLTIAGTRALVARIRAFGPVRAIEGHGEEVLEPAALTAWLDELEAAADLAEAHGQEAPAAAPEGDLRDLAVFMAAGLRHG